MVLVLPPPALRHLLRRLVPARAHVEAVRRGGRLPRARSPLTARPLPDSQPPPRLRPSAWLSSLEYPPLAPSRLTAPSNPVKCRPQKCQHFGFQHIFDGGRARPASRRVAEVFRLPEATNATSLARAREKIVSIVRHERGRTEITSNRASRRRSQAYAVTIEHVRSMEQEARARRTLLLLVAIVTFACLPPRSHNYWRS